MGVSGSSSAPGCLWLHLRPVLWAPCLQDGPLRTLLYLISSCVSGPVFYCFWLNLYDWPRIWSIAAHWDDVHIHSCHHTSGCSTCCPMGETQLSPSCLVTIWGYDPSFNCWTPACHKFYHWPSHCPLLPSGEREFPLILANNISSELCIFRRRGWNVWRQTFPPAMKTVQMLSL